MTVVLLRKLSISFLKKMLCSVILWRISLSCRAKITRIFVQTYGSILSTIETENQVAFRTYVTRQSFAGDGINK